MCVCARACFCSFGVRARVTLSLSKLGCFVGLPPGLLSPLSIFFLIIVSQWSIFDQNIRRPKQKTKKNTQKNSPFLTFFPRVQVSWQSQWQTSFIVYFLSRLPFFQIFVSAICVHLLHGHVFHQCPSIFSICPFLRPFISF